MADELAGKKIEHLREWIVFLTLYSAVDLYVKIFMCDKPLTNKLTFSLISPKIKGKLSFLPCFDKTY